MASAKKLNTTRAHRLKGEVVPPEHTLALINELGITRAARELGVSTTTLHKARKSQEVSRVIEVAATGVMVGEHPATTNDDTRGERMYLLECDGKQAPLVERFAKAIHASLLRA